jgi:FdhD protein
MERSTEAVREEVVGLYVNGLLVSTWTASPDHLEALGAGRLLAAGFIREVSQLLRLDVAREGRAYRIVAEIPPERLATAIQEREHRAAHGCGLRYLTGCRPDLLPRRSGPGAEATAGAARPRPGIPALEAFADLLRELFERSPSRRTTGGHHTTALSDGSRLVHVHEVVGRHNGADKAIGAALLAGSDLSTLGLVTTARISGGIAEKAARAGLAWIASRSVPTTLAVEIAGAAGIPIVARAGGREARVFGPGEPA